MYSVREVIESFIRKLQADITPHAVLINKNDFFETTDIPSLLIQGPTITENKNRRTATLAVKEYRIDEEAKTYEARNYPRFYHFDFDFILTTGNEEELLDLQEKVIQFFMLNPVLAVNAEDNVNLLELTPIGGLARPNLTNLRQASGRYRLEDVLIYPGDDPISGKLILDRIFEYLDFDSEEIMETRTHNPPEE